MAYLKLDLKVSNPKKLYRKIYDVCEDEISSRGYHLAHKASFKPFLKENALYNIADFFGRITIYRDIFSINRMSLIFGLIAVAVGIILFVYPNLYTPTIPKEGYGIIAIITGIIIIFLKSKSSLIIQIDLEGEGYRTKSTTQNNANTVQEGKETKTFEELSVVSDVRLTITGWLKEANMLGGSPNENMKRDLTTLTEKIKVVVEPYIVKN